MFELLMLSENHWESGLAAAPGRDVSQAVLRGGKKNH